MENDYIEKVQEYRDEQTRQAELDKQSSELITNTAKIERAVILQGEKTRRNIQNIKPIDPIASPEDIQSVVDTLNSLGEKLQPDFQPVIDGLKVTTEAISKLPTEYPEFPKIEIPQIPDFPKNIKVDNLGEIKPWLQSVVEAIGKIQLAPVVKVDSPTVNVPETKIDTTSITDGLKRVEKALSSIKLPETDLTSLEKAVKATTTAINSLRFPVPNYVLPFKDEDGKAVQGTIDASGNLKVATSTVAVTDAFNLNDIAAPYFGYTDLDADWLVRKIVDGVGITYATVANNPSVTSYEDAWADKESLTYGRYDEAF